MTIAVTTTVPYRTVDQWSETLGHDVLAELVGLNHRWEQNRPRGDRYNAVDCRGYVRASAVVELGWAS